MTFKVIIAGGRDFNDMYLLNQKVTHLLSNIEEDVEIVSGGARGADTLGEEWAALYGYDLKVFPVDWDTYGKAAGPIRNAEMADYADALIAFWNGYSKGTEGMIQVADKKGLEVRVVRYE